MEPANFVIARLPNSSYDHGPLDFGANMSCFEYLEKFLGDGDDHVFDIIVEETNRYAASILNANNPATRHARSNDWQPVTKEEISAFFGMYLAMGIVRKPTVASYWEVGSGDNNSLTDTPNFANIMSRNRFQAILRFLHCNDNATATERGQPGYDPLHKISNIVEFFNRTFEMNYNLEQDVCIDERMIGFKGRHFLKQYLANKKAHRWGVKAFVLAESRTGYTHQVEIYKGKANTPRCTNGQGYRVVMDLMRPHFGNNHHLTIDSWFCSPKLIHALRDRGTYATGTVVSSGKGLPPSFKTAKLPKGDVLVKTQGPVMATLYNDRRQVTLLTTAGSAKMQRQTNSKGKAVYAPQVVHRYNQTMGGVDLGDQLLGQYEPRFRSVKLWKKILFSFLMMATVNAYICYKNTYIVRRKMDHLSFQKAVIGGLIGNFRQGKSKRGRHSLQCTVRLTARHFISYIPDKRRMKCAVCTGKGNRFSGSRVRTWCPDCGVGLCLEPCFKSYHTLLQYEE